MRISDIGERETVKIFERRFKKCSKAVVGIGDDAAVLEMNERNYLVISTDSISQKIHIPKEMTPRQIGSYAANAALSDIAAMGATPLGMLVSACLPNSTDTEFVEELAEGLNDTCRRHGICVLGGDTKEQESIVITVTALGKVEKKKLLRRSGAREGDLICVTGMMGSAAAGFYCIIKELDIEEEIREKFVRAAMEPAARVEAGILISGHASSCIDISDGLAWSLHEIARASGRGFTVEMDKIPFDRDVERVAGAAGVSVDDIIFFKGGDYELLFTIPEKNYENVRKSLAEAGGVSVIGRIKESGTLIERDGSAVELEGTGYDSFKTRF